MNPSFRKRCYVLCSVLVAGLSLLSWRLVQIQLVNNRQYADKASRTYVRVEKLTATRGLIVDRNEEPLAKSIPVSTVFVDKNHLGDPKIASYGIAYREASSSPDWEELDATARRRRINGISKRIIDTETAESICNKHLAYAIGILARPLGMTRDELRSRIENSRGKWVPIAKDLPEDIADRLREAVKENWIQGFEFENSIKRWYTAPTLASHVIGYTGEIEEEDQNGNKVHRMAGRFGVEIAMEEYLAGRDGWRRHNRDQHGLVVPGDSGSLFPPRAGLNVQLTLDMGLQSIVEEELDAALKEFESVRGAVILMEPKTGEILAMVSRPSFDLNHKKDVAKNSFNYAIQAVYEPGSTFKIIPTAGVINEGLATPLTSIYCHNGVYVEGKIRVPDHHPYGQLTLTGVLQKSSNIGSYMCARQLGTKRFYDYVDRFGFGKSTSILLSGESRGIARNTGNAVDFSRASYGYALNVTPLQMASAYSAIAGDGKLMKPKIIRALIANDGTVVEDFPPEVVSQALSSATAMKMRKALESVIEPGGTATLAAVPGFRVAGKTGTARKHNPNGRGYLPNSYTVSFAGMMPAQDPAFVCVVVIDDPRTTKVSRYGGTIAAPTFGKIAARVATRMNLQPTEPVPPPLANTNSRQ